jgi:DNA polymerase
MYHPAAALHQQSLRTTIESDFQRLPELIANAAQAPEKAEAPQPPEEKIEPKQLSLF